jgi:deazaflavin-dependent oxidoreductase (nitroreductase family)
MSVKLTPRGTRGTEFFSKMPPWMMGIFTAVNVGMFRLFGRRMRIQGRPLLLLTTAGAKTGKRRQSTLAWFDDDPARTDTWLVVAAKAGAATHPAWYVNLARRPTDVSIDVAGDHVAVESRSLDGQERENTWKRIVALAPGYGAYAVKTDREIPVVRLTRKS